MGRCTLNQAIADTLEATTLPADKRQGILGHLYAARATLCPARAGGNAGACELCGRAIDWRMERYERRAA